MSKGNPRVYARVPKETYEQVISVANELKIDVSELIKRALNAYLPTAVSKNGSERA